jgi:hypothetical protein
MEIDTSCAPVFVKQVAEHILKLKEQRKLLTIGLLWSWWEWDARNKSNAGEQRKSTGEVVYRARMAIIHTEIPMTVE